MLCTQHCTRIRWAELLGKYWGGQDRRDSWLMEKLYRPVCLSWGVLLSFFECGLHLLSAPGWGLSAVPLNRSVCSVFLWLLFSRLLSYSVKMREGLVWDRAMPALNKSYATLYPIRMSLKEHLWGWCLCSVRVSVLKRSTRISIVYLDISVWVSGKMLHMSIGVSRGCLHVSCLELDQ